MHVCPTKLLWTRVRFSIVRTLRETTLADLLRAPAAAPSAQPAPTGPPLPRSTRHSRPLTTRSLKRNMADLEISDLHVRTEDREILRGVDLEHQPRRDPRADGPERLRQVDARQHAARPPLL